MGSVSIPCKALLFMGLLYNQNVDFSHLLQTLERQFGSVWKQSPPYAFYETNYYNTEMGNAIQRIYVAFKKLIRMEELTDIKLHTNRMETDMFSREHKRNANIDPGYITSAKVVLATTKNNQHRVYLRDGIYAEVTLRFRKKSFTPWEWTYKDYRRAETIQFFNSVRLLYREIIENPL
jgi:hypothetical protein